MLFNSGTFLQFFAAFLLLYYCVRNHLAARNVLIVLASYFFYGWWDYRFLALLLLSSLADFAVGLGLERLARPRARQALLTVSLVVNLGILGCFKYYDFFIASLMELLGQIGVQAQPPLLRVILPVGISFYTFQTMSYAIDVYRREIPATRNLVEFLAYVSFFPQLVAGPIERGKHLLPQFSQARRITRPMLEEGIWLCVWGMFKKVVLADNLAPLVEMVYDQPRPGALMVVLATLAFGGQIYCDFSGYSDIARGTARILGFEIMVNFNLPYVARNVREFWSRWHISLSTWLRDYLYIPLGGNRRGPLQTHRNLFLTMLLGGLWHGASWNFVAWGAWHGLGLAAHRFWSARRDVAPERPARAMGAAVSWALTMAFVFYGWLLFRAGSWEQIVALTRALGDPSRPAWTASYCLNLALFLGPLVAMQSWQFARKDLLAPLQLRGWVRTLLQGALLAAIILFWEKEKVAFIYFQF
jgi:D-alanyl-lipoteichoic acid acyltransferase DltB (MBOAT superfamily)